ncbi:hypothetical protein N185_16935 [Sinorhizobium sp. GW3]|nr:hypothetical protein N185_16935 [Sinorhizobium sp. GW3]
MIFERISEDLALEAAAIIVQAYAEPPWNEKWNLEGATTRLLELSNTPGWLGVGALEDRAICGFAIGHPYTSASGTGLYIPEIAVLPRYQRRGIGTQLLKLLEEEACKCGYKSTWLLSQKQGAAAEYYMACGYKQDQNVRVYARSIR